MPRVVKVYGSLAKFLGQRQFKAEVATPAEAVRFLVANFPGLRAHMAEQHYEVRVGRRVLTAGEEPEQLHHPAGRDEAITLKPVVTGAGATGRIIAGVALFALSFALPGAQLGLFGLGQVGLTAFAAPIAGIGLSLALGGVAQLLAPTPQIQSGPDSEKDPRKSYSFSGIQNVSRQGLPVPVIYGEVIVGSITVSAGIDIEQVEVTA